MAHEQSETIQNKSGKWVNIYGKQTPQAGQPLPKRGIYERSEYDTVEEATAAARRRSEEEGLGIYPSKMAHGASLTPKGDIGEHRGMEAKKLFPKVGGKTAKSSSYFPKRPVRQANG